MARLSNEITDTLIESQPRIPDFNNHCMFCRSARHLPWPDLQIVLSIFSDRRLKIFFCTKSFIDWIHLPPWPLIPSSFPSMALFNCQFLLRTCPIQLAFLQPIVVGNDLSSFTLLKTSSLDTWSVHFILFSFFSTEFKRSPDVYFLILLITNIQLGGEILFSDQ